MLGTIAGVIEVSAQFAENAGCDADALGVSDECVEDAGDGLGVGRLGITRHRTLL